MTEHQETLFVVGNARTGSDNSITHCFSSFFIGFLVDRQGVILEAQASVVLDLTGRFLSDLFKGRSLAFCDETLVDEIRRRYLGSSQKAVIVAYRDAVLRFQGRSL